MGDQKDFLQNSGNLLSRRAAALEDFLSRLRKNLNSAVIRAGQYTWRQLKLGLWNVLHLLQLAVIFLVLALFGSLFHELTFLKHKSLTAIGWVGIVGVSLIALWALFVVIAGSKQEPSGKSRIGSYLAIVLFAFIVLDLLAAKTSYRLHTPLLKSMQISSSTVVGQIGSLLRRVRHEQSDKSEVRKNALPPINPPAPGPQAISVHCQTDDGKSGAAAFPSDNRDVQLNMWVEHAWLTDDGIILDLAVKTWYPSTTEDLKRADGAYIVDDWGRVYDLANDSGNYSLLHHLHSVVGDQTYRFQLTFRPKLDHKATYVKLHHPQFQILTVNFLPGG